MIQIHTPTPYSHQVAMSSDNHHESYILADCSSKIIAYTAREKEGLTFEQTRANAAFIVRACNSHDALVEVLKRALYNAEHNREQDTWAIRAALKLAGGV